MSRGHSTSRRRNYGPRQREVRARRALPTDLDPRTLEWPRGSGWSSSSAKAAATPDLIQGAGQEEAA